MSAPSRVPASLHLLLRPSADGTPAAAAPPSARLARWLGQADACPAPAALPRDHAARLAGLDGPVAWATVFARTRDAAPDTHWLWLEPVRMQAGLNNVGMAPPQGPLDAAALQALHTRLVPLFADAGASLEVAAGRLLAGFPAPLDATCVAPELAFGAVLRDCLPAGPDAGRLRRLMTECQMVLHRDDEDRESAAAANAVWPWGNGTLPAFGGARGACIISTDPLLAALGHLVAGVAAGPPSDLAALADRFAAAAPLPSTLVVTPSADHPDLDTLLGAAGSALGRGQLEHIEIALWPAVGTGIPPRAVRLGRWSRLRWWRRPVSPWSPAHD